MKCILDPTGLLEYYKFSTFCEVTAIIQTMFINIKSIAIEWLDDQGFEVQLTKFLTVRKSYENSAVQTAKFVTVRKTYEFLGQNEYRTKTYEDSLEKQRPIISKKTHA